MASDVSQEELEALLKKVDKESTFRKLTGFDHWLVFWIAVAFTAPRLWGVSEEIGTGNPAPVACGVVGAYKVRYGRVGEAHAP